MPSNSPNFSFFIYDSTADEASLFKDYIDHMADNFGILDDIIVGEITDITLTTPANGELLILDTGVWINKTLAEAGISATGHTHTASNVTDFDTEVGNHTDVAANTTHRGITAGNPHGAEVEDLSDVTLASAGDKEMLTYNTSGGNWINRTAAEVGLSETGHTHAASNITDFDTEVSNNSTVDTNTTHSGTTTGNPHSLDMDDLDSVYFGKYNSLTTDDYLVYDGTDWVNGPFDINAISDVTISSSTDNEVLAYNNATSKWINQTAAEAGLATASDVSVLQAYGTINTKSASSTLALTDANDFIKCTSATAMNLTVPPNSSVAFTIGTVIDVLNYGAGVVTIVAGSGVTLRSIDSNLDISGQYGGVTLKKLATDEWSVIGALE